MVLTVFRTETKRIVVVHCTDIGAVWCYTAQVVT